jgi:hypothetical protein
VADDDREPAGERPLMTLREAAAATGRPPEAIRAMIRRGRLLARKNNAGRFLIDLPPDLIRPDPAPAAAGTAAADGRLAGLEVAVEEWRAAAEEARLEAAVAAAENRLLREERARDQERIGRLEAELAEARRPWWRR